MDVCAVMANKVFLTLSEPLREGARPSVCARAHTDGRAGTSGRAATGAPAAARGSRPSSRSFQRDRPVYPAPAPAEIDMAAAASQPESHRHPHMA